MLRARHQMLGATQDYDAALVKRVNGIDACAGLAYDALGGIFRGCDTDLGLLT